METGGTSGSGGETGSGGAPSSGGAPGSGGETATGGAGTGGAASGGSGTGGRGTGGAATGGAATGGAATGGAATGGSGTGGAATGGRGTGGAGTGGAATGGSGTGGITVVKCHIVVNELQTTGANGDADEFVELYNACPDSADISGYQLSYRSAGNNSGGADSTLYVFPSDSKFVGGGYIIIAGAKFPGTAGARFTSGGMHMAGGAVALRDATASIVDSVAYEMLTTANFFTEGPSGAANPPTMSSIIRFPNGTDTDSNARDFRISTAPTPGATNL